MLIPKWLSNFGISVSFKKPLVTYDQILIIKDKKITHYDDVDVYEFHCKNGWWLRSIGGPDHVSEFDVIKMYNLVEVDKAYRVKYECRGNCIERIISINGVSFNDEALALT